MTATEIREAAKSLLLFLALATLPVYIARHSQEMQRGKDFPEFYAAAKIVSAGRGHELYQSATQEEFQIRHFGGVGPYFNHPPFETLLYLPFAFCPPPYAHWLWFVFSLGLLFAVAWRLKGYVLKGFRWSVVLLAYLMFIPLLLDFLQGQDSVLLLLVLASTFVALKNGQEFAGGCLLACGLFKPHLVLPVLFALLPGAGRKLLAGFASVSIILLLISLEICGWNVLSAYPQFVWQSRSLPLAGIHVEQMANLHGLIVRLFPHSAPLELGLTMAGSILILWLAIRGWMAAAKYTDRTADLGFANLVMAASLVSYHLSPHDLTILLLPLTLIFNYVLLATGIPTWMRVAFIATLAVAFLPPLDLFLLREHLYAYASLPTLTLFCLSRVEIGRSAMSGKMNALQRPLMG
jgi:hypothetical protein